MRGATGGALLVLFVLSCGDDDGPSPAEMDAGEQLDLGSSDVGIEPPDDAGQVNTCLDPELQHLPCCWESSNADRDVLQFAARGVSFVLPESFANEVFRTTVQEGLDAADGGELNFMLLVRATPMGSGYRAEIGYGCRSSREEPWRFGPNGLCGASDDRWAPVPVAATIVDDVLSTETAEAPAR